MLNKELYHYPAAPGASENYSFLTSIIEARDTTEQRRRMRVRPRMSIRYQIPLNKCNAAEVDALISKAIGSGSALPRWHRSTTVESVDSETGVVTVARNLPLDVMEGSFLSVDGDVFPVSSISAERRSVILDTTGYPDISFPIGCAVVPLWVCMLSPTNNQNASSPISGVTEVDGGRVVGAEAVPPDAPDSTLPVLTVDNLDIMTMRPRWASERSISTEWARDDADYGVGYVGYHLRAKAPIKMRNYEYLLSGVDEIDWMINFFWRQYGRQRRFVMPQWGIDHDIISETHDGLSISINGSNFGIQATRVNCAYLMTTSPVDGKNHFLPILSIAPDTVSDTTTITLAHGAPNYTVLESKRTTFCSTVRFASDSIDVTYINSNTATVAFGTMEVKV